MEIDGKAHILIRDALNREITLADVREFFSRNVSLFAALIVLLYFCSPLVEMIVCLLNRVERTYPLAYYPTLIVNRINPLACILGMCALAGLICRARAEKAAVLRVFRERRMYLCFSLMVVCVVFSTIANYNASIFFIGDFYRNEPTLLVISYVLVYLFCASLVRSEWKERLVFLTVVISILLGIYSSIRYALVLRGIEYSVSPYSVAVFFQFNHYGYYLAAHTML